MSTGNNHPTRRYTREARANMSDSTNDVLAKHTDVTYQVWVADSNGVPLYVYRDDLISPVAHNWAAAWNRSAPTDTHPGQKFVVARATTTFEVVA